VADAPLARQTRIRVRYADTDRMGVAYHANYLVWFEVGRTEWLRESGWTYRQIEEDGVSLPVIEAHCEYRLPARYDDEIEISTAATVLSQVRIRFDYEARLSGSSTLAATGHTVHASLGTDGRPRRLPSRVLELLPRGLRRSREDRRDGDRRPQNASA
jgi:acyl-CoA thioester hydrolase